MFNNEPLTVDNEKVKSLMEMGFPKNIAEYFMIRNALKKYSNNLPLATEHILNGEDFSVPIQNNHEYNKILHNNNPEEKNHIIVANQNSMHNQIINIRFLII